MEYTDGNCKYKIEKIGVVLKNEPIQISINSDYVNSCNAYRYGNIVTVHASIKKVDGNTESIVYASGLPTPEIFVTKSTVTNNGHTFRYHVDSHGNFGEHWISQFTPSQGNELEVYFMYLCK